MRRRKIYFDDGSLQREIKRAYEIIAACKELLERSRPDTFLGRQCHNGPAELRRGGVSGGDGSRPADLLSKDHSSDEDETARPVVS